MPGCFNNTKVGSASFVIALLLLSFCKAYSEKNILHVIKTGASFEKMYMQDELYSYLTYSGGHPQFYLGYTLDFSKNVVTLLGTGGFATLHSSKNENGVPLIDLQNLDITLKWQRKLFFYKPLQLTFSGGLAVSEWYTWKYFVLRENELSNPFNTNIVSAGFNMQLKYSPGKHTISTELTSPLLFCVSRRKEYNLIEYSSKIKTVRSMQNFSAILKYAFQFSRQFALSAFYQLHYMHYPTYYKLNTSSDNIGLQIEFTLQRKNVK